jgi:hypothetical protein
MTSVDGRFGLACDLDVEIRELEWYAAPSYILADPERESHIWEICQRMRAIVRKLEPDLTQTPYEDASKRHSGRRKKRVGQST